MCKAQSSQKGKNTSTWLEIDEKFCWKLSQTHSLESQTIPRKKANFNLIQFTELPLDCHTTLHKGEQSTFQVCDAFSKKLLWFSCFPHVTNWNVYWRVQKKCIKPRNLSLKGDGMLYSRELHKITAAEKKWQTTRRSFESFLFAVTEKRA